MNNLTNSILMNMYYQGSINDKKGDNMAYIDTNDPNIVIEVERKNNTNNIWNNNLYNRYIIYLRFKDVMTNRVILELSLYNIEDVKCLLDLIEEWISFNYTYDFNYTYEMVYPLYNNNYYNGISNSIHLSYKKEFIMYIDQYDKNTDTNIHRLTISLGYDDKYLYEFIDTVFFVCLIDIVDNPEGLLPGQ